MHCFVFLPYNASIRLGENLAKVIWCPDGPSRNKINLEKVLASLYTLCIECGYKIQPSEERRINSDQMRCPKCGAAFTPGQTSKKGRRI
jgi:predicted RNA-binding Zn-ribbon protein involved in translation (DUF1610 family)